MPPVKRRLPFRYIEPVFFGGLLDDPLLFLRIRPLKRALLFDCGQIAHLAKRVVKPIDAVFITHAHMDHIMGIPTLVRHHHASPRPMDVFGPPGIIERVEHLLLGFEWNLSESNWFTLRVHEIRADRLLHCSFPGPKSFRRSRVTEEQRTGRQIWSCPYATVEAELLDHKLPVLGFRIQEQPHFAIDYEKLDRLGIMPGEWIRDLKNRVWKGRSNVQVEIEVEVEQRETENSQEKPCPDSLLINSGCSKIVRSSLPEKAPRSRSSATAHKADFEDGGEMAVFQQPVKDPHALYGIIHDNRPCVSIGYVCDVGWTADNVAAMESLLKGVTLLCSDCTFLAEDRDKARASYHLCTRDLNELAELLAPGYLLPMHMSKSYLKKSFDIYNELRPPEGTKILRLPKHLVPAPLTVSDVDEWMKT
ncbi:MBL fold metallo-hydrolase [Pelotalea chapellei]|uniref:MBL fold metallo-hydrolase n=1 Tax=Pelotalea chapellei TaxID=44671 RepID=A0ABS5U3G3_9BACT|nr:MBL fold metallo-hydrolase [Pelotalea chapellei]MBT1070213.1 MBL fold metallo-hydrolase [Pelotalea chapellei]